MTNVYGGRGNRWWVGLNVGSDQSTILGTASVLSPNGYESLPSGNAADDRQFAAAAARDRGAARPVTISVENVSWYNINGPYPTQAAADAAIAGIQRAHPAPGEVQQVANEAVAGNGQYGAASAPVANPLSGLAAIGAFFTSLADASTWIRVAKVVIGGALVIVGLSHMTGASGTVATAARKVPLPI